MAISVTQPRSIHSIRKRDTPRRSTCAPIKRSTGRSRRRAWAIRRAIMESAAEEEASAAPSHAGSGASRGRTSASVMSWTRSASGSSLSRLRSKSGYGIENVPPGGCARSACSPAAPAKIAVPLVRAPRAAGTQGSGAPVTNFCQSRSARGDFALSSIPPASIRITDEQVAFFHENGFLAIEAITTEDEVARMRVAYDEIFARRAGRDEGMQFDLAGTDAEDEEAALPQILDPRRFSEALRDTLYEANALAIARQLLGPEARMTGSHAIFKPAGHGAATPWHQDEAYWDPAANHLALSVWMPLQEATLENGCMQFIPGSHRLEVLGHHHINHDPRIHGLEVDEKAADLEKAVACPLPPGGATFHLSRRSTTRAPTGPRCHAGRSSSASPSRWAAAKRRASFPWQREEVSSHTLKQQQQAGRREPSRR
jgi:hypothetical protein